MTRTALILFTAILFFITANTAWAACDAPDRAPGDLCGDGTYYIGDMEGAAVYAADAGHETSVPWNNGSSNWLTAGVDSKTDGRANTAKLVALSDAASPYRAAAYCDGLEAHGHDDWYLPAKDELALFWQDGKAVAGVSTEDVWYISSTEYAEHSTFGAWIHRFMDGVQFNGLKSHDRFLIRCVRR